MPNGSYLACNEQHHESQNHGGPAPRGPVHKCCWNRCVLGGVSGLLEAWNLTDPFAQPLLNRLSQHLLQCINPLRQFEMLLSTHEFRRQFLNDRGRLRALPIAPGGIQRPAEALAVLGTGTTQRPWFCRVPAQTRQSANRIVGNRAQIAAGGSGPHLAILPELPPAKYVAPHFSQTY
jgi:hypothetical protein